MVNVDVTLYAITDRGAIGQRDFYEAIEAALKGGATILQLREKGLDEVSLIEEAKKVKKICSRYGVPLIINDNYKAAVAAGADGVHVGIEDAPVAEIRSKAGSGFIIGATAKTVEQAKAAQAAGADYLGVGAVFPSPTKKNTRKNLSTHNPAGQLFLNIPKALPPKKKKKTRGPPTFFP